MTETQATPGATSTDSDGAESPDGAAPVREGDNGASGRAVVGRASVGGDGAGPRFTRAPGMPPPPDSADPAAPTSSPPASNVSTGRASVPATARIAVNSTAVGGRAAPVDSATAPISGAAVGAANAAGARTRAVPLGTGRVAEAVRNARAAVSSAASRGPRRARLFVKRIDPWSVMKFSFAVSFVLFFVAIVATAVLYLALDAMGVFNSVNRALSEMIGATGSKNGGFKITALGVIGVAGVLGLVNVVLFTALATLSAFIYNVCADLVGGIEVTLSERE
ncbi:MAG: hypothetical protein AUI10_09635 [Actinobacteria bacterium 13_2_20CM_2_72_6]|nr:MAG: hypothetical protein AUI10_09635 [Actinobacteria bacterium 13_2_20CM_2_72_6]